MHIPPPGCLCQPIEYVLPSETGDTDNAEPKKGKRPRNLPTVYHDYQCDSKFIIDYTLLPDLERLFVERSLECYLIKWNLMWCKAMFVHWKRNQLNAKSFISSYLNATSLIQWKVKVMFCILKELSFESNAFLIHE